MNLWRLIRRSLGFYWRTNLGVLLAILVSTAVLTGALALGDSVRHTLMMAVNARLGKTQLALGGQDRFFRAGLADELADELNAQVVPVLHLRGLIADADGKRRANRVDVFGVDERFFRIGPGGNPFGGDWSEGLVANEPLAAVLAVREGDEVVLRVDKPGLMSRDIALTPDSDLSVAFRLKIRAIARESDFGRFGLEANQVSALNVFVPLQWLQERLHRSGQANTLLVAASEKADISAVVGQVLKSRWQLADAALELRDLNEQGMLELRSSRVFIDESVGRAAMSVGKGAIGILTYFVNQLRLGDKTTAYSMVAAMEPSADADSFIPANMQDDEILINEWLAEDLGANIGDSIELTYFVVGPARKLREAGSSFRIRGILPMKPPAVDAELMPGFPGLADVNNCRDWKPGIPIVLEKIRQRDEDYWNRYRGSPKAFVTLKAGQAMWANMYGDLTAVRYRQSNNAKEAVTKAVLDHIDPAAVGLFFQSVRERGVKAGGGSTDFGQLFLGLSMFIIIASLILTGLLFVFGVENRKEQIGMLMAVGFTPKLVRRLLLAEAAILSVSGAIGGTAAGLFYTRAMSYGLATIWGEAAAGSTIRFHAEPSTLLAGALSAAFVSLAAIRLTLHKQVSRPVRELLSGGLQWRLLVSGRVSKGRAALLVSVTAAIGAGLLIAVLGAGDSGQVTSAFFGAGALLLIAGVALCRALLTIGAAGSIRPVTSLVGLGLRNATRRGGRSLAVVGLLACGVFMVIAVGANRRDPLAQAHRRDSGTGGFALFGESAIGIPYDLGSRDGRDTSGLGDGSLSDVDIVQLRVHDGDDASCFNMNRPQSPRLLGVKPGQLQNRGAFRFTGTTAGAEREDGWLVLDRDEGPDVVPAVGDYPTIAWALGKSVGDKIEYVDQKGRRFWVLLAGIFQGSILQGSLLISEDQFVRRFPAEDGYRMLLVDARADEIGQVTEKLSYTLRDFGLALTPARQRLAAFSFVENTYLSIFQILGGLGLILGSVGLGLVVLLNVLDRRGELAMLRAVGFDRATLSRMVLYEHWGLMLAGLLCGVVAAMVAIGPALRSPGAKVPYFSLMLTILAIAGSGVIWIQVATRFSLGGEMLEALRNE